MKILSVFLIAFLFLSGGCGSPKQANGRVSTRELKSLHGKTRDEVREVLGKPNGFYTRSAEGRWHYSDLLMDQAGAGEPRRVYVIVYFSQFGEHRATLVEIHDHKDE